MGSYLSRNSGEVEELDIPANSSYRYPPKSGNYFGSHFIMGGTKFETMQPEAYLFGENTDLNFLGPKPYSFPYKVCSPSQPVKALRCLVNIRKDSLRLVKVPSALNKRVSNEDDTGDLERQITAEEGEEPFLYNIEFTFDADCPCSITIYYNASEEMVNKNVIYSPDPTRDCSDTAHYNAGCNQQFCLPTHRVDPAKLAKSDVDWTKGYTKIPIVIQVCADCGPKIVGHSHITYAEFYKPVDNAWSIRAVKQKQAIEGVCFLLQEIYGIENKNAGSKGSEENQDDDDLEDDSSECVICLSETRDTLILPCKHLCLCSSCANKLRYQENGCPICRQSFRALLQIRAVRKKTDSVVTPGRRGQGTSGSSEDAASNAGTEEEEDEAEIVVPVPPGYEVISLIEAIKGCVAPQAKPIPEPSTASTSVDNIRVVDETATVSPVSSFRSTIKEEGVCDSDSESDIEDVDVRLHPRTTSPLSIVSARASPEKVKRANESGGNEDEVHVYTEIPLPGAAMTEASGDSGESQKSTKELLHKEREGRAGSSEEEDDEEPTVHIYAEV